jgi:hypothetical protein
MTTGKSAREILQRADETLFTASLGLEHTKGTDAKTRIAGLRNVVVFGRAVTNVLQNLRSVDKTFDDWCQPHVEAMRNDELLRYFYELRTQILKQGALPIASSVTLSGNPMAIFARFKPPPLAKGFFIGDNIGGSGWEVETENGATEKFYVQLPPDLSGLKIDVNIHLPDAPEQFRAVPVPALCEAYLAKLSVLLEEAKARYA